MRTIIVASILVVSLVGSASAQTPVEPVIIQPGQMLEWDQPVLGAWGLGQMSWDVLVDGKLPEGAILVTYTSCHLTSNEEATCEAPAPAMATGPHEITVRVHEIGNPFTRTTDWPLKVLVAVPPSMPLNLRIKEVQR